MEEVLQKEIARCEALRGYYKDKGQSGVVIMSIIGADIQRAEKAIEDKSSNEMFHALRALRQNN